MTIGVLLVNLGTPAAPTTLAVRRYLKEFLSDPRVLDLPAGLRYMLLYGWILPFRSRRSAAAYQQIWTSQGSPLWVHSQHLVEQVQSRLGMDYCVRLGMRYGQPALSSSVTELMALGCTRIIVLPLFPQYATASTGSAVAAVLQSMAQSWNIPSLTIGGDFFAAQSFVQALSQVLQAPIATAQPEVVIFSFHGLPERHLIKSGCSQVMACRRQPCPAVTAENRFCYRAQCFATAAALASQLGLAPTSYRVAFQSRLGRTPWIEPDVNQVLTELAQQGVRRVAVACPSFVADCLETLEEIGIRAKASWRALTGGELTLLPCLNSHPAWVDVVASWVLNLRGCLHSC